MALLKIIKYEPPLYYDGPNPNDFAIRTKINYVTNTKANPRRLYGGYNFLCLKNTNAIVDEFIVLSNTYRGFNFIPIQHIALSLNPYSFEDNVTPQQLAMIVDRFCLNVFSNDYQVIWGIHEDECHLHAHIVINTVNLRTGTLLPWDKEMMNFIYEKMLFYLKLNSHWKGPYPITNLTMCYGSTY